MRHYAENENGGSRSLPLLLFIHGIYIGVLFHNLYGLYGLSQEKLATLAGTLLVQKFQKARFMRRNA